MAQIFSILTLFLLFYLLFMGPLTCIDATQRLILIIAGPLIVNIIFSIFFDNKKKSKPKTSSKKNTLNKTRHNRLLPKEEFMNYL